MGGVLERFRKPFPADERLNATGETAQAWDRIIRIDRAAAVFRTQARLARRLAKRLANEVAGTSSDDRSDDLAERQSQVTDFEWSGPAGMVVAKTSPSLRVGQPLHRRLLKTEFVTGFPDGWLRMSPVEVTWQPTPDGPGSSSGSSRSIDVARMPASDIVDIELVDLGRHGAGLTITGANDDQLWLYVPDRKKLDAMAKTVRYGDRS